eukprot:3642922-Pleurochrysis_carterae.AAC.3
MPRRRFLWVPELGEAGLSSNDAKLSTHLVRVLVGLALRQPCQVVLAHEAAGELHRLGRVHVPEVLVERRQLGAQRLKDAHHERLVDNASAVGGNGLHLRLKHVDGARNGAHRPVKLGQRVRVTCHTAQRQHNGMKKT